jgi:hypothetical protein
VGRTIGPTHTSWIRKLAPLHQPPVTEAALTFLICAHACAGTHRTFGPVLRIRAPENSAAARHPAAVGNCAHDGSFDGAVVGPAASLAPRDRTQFLEHCVLHQMTPYRLPRPLPEWNADVEAEGRKQMGTKTNWGQTPLRTPFLAALSQHRCGAAKCGVPQ